MEAIFIPYPLNINALLRQKRQCFNAYEFTGDYRRLSKTNSNTRKLPLGMIEENSHALPKLANSQTLTILKYVIVSFSISNFCSGKTSIALGILTKLNHNIRFSNFRIHKSYSLS